MNRLTLAIDFAAKKHKDQRRKDAAKTPYINHPIEVMNLLAEAEITDIDTLCAAVLHDTVEDTATTPKEIEDLFGKNVATIVGECTDDKSLPKVQRKKLQIEHVKAASTAAKLVKMADKYSNLCDLQSNPPKSWGPDRVRGYAIWCHAVIVETKGVNEKLEKKLNDLFGTFGINDMEPNKLNEQLEQYYANIQNSE